ncbi:MAG TPA: hypothetical protein VEI97_05040 [bacterium]|nr:hypothetical protein [bacterium]
MERLPNFVTFVNNLPDAEVEAICQHLARNEDDFLRTLAGLTKFRAVFIKRAKPSQQRLWFRKYSGTQQEFAPLWILAYGTSVLMPVEEAALHELRIALKSDLGYDPGDPPPTPDEIEQFLRSAGERFGLTHARQWGNVLLLLMDPSAKAPVAEALDRLGWNLAMDPVSTAEAEEGSNTEGDENQAEPLTIETSGAAAES